MIQDWYLFPVYVAVVYTPESIQKFVELCGVSKADSSVDYAMLEYCIREDLKLKAPRYMAVLDPIN